MNTVARVYRGELVDMTHQAHVAVVDCEGQLLHSLGDPTRVTYVRSSAKPMQALVALESGAVDAYGLDERELALLCASHNGESFHTTTVERILGKAGLDTSYLQCGTHPSLNAQVALSQGELQAKHSNCSGKHAGMLITTKFLAEDVSTYYTKEHPHQQRIVQKIAELCEVEEESIVMGIDGCGVPVHALPLERFAFGYAKLATMNSLVSAAMSAYPEMVAGTNRLCTDLMRLCGDRLFAKLGADGYYAVGLKEKTMGITCKVEDGKIAIVEGLVLHVLRALEVFSEEEWNALETYHSPVLKNHKGEVVGKTVFEVRLKSH